MSVEELYKSKVGKMAQEVAKLENVMILDIKFLTHSRKRVVQIFIYSPRGVGLNECVHFSKKLSNLLDEEELFMADYNLEVSSPGLDFKLTKPLHYQVFNGKKVKFVLNSPIEGKKQGIGVIDYCDEDSVIFKLDKNEQEIKTDFSNIKKCRLYPEFDF